jgi:two-component sensor histidine kinase
VEISVHCGLILNELLSNAFKYAFPKGRHGRLKIRLSQDKEVTLPLVLPPGVTCEVRFKSEL